MCPAAGWSTGAASSWTRTWRLVRRLLRPAHLAAPMGLRRGGASRGASERRGTIKDYPVDAADRARIASLRLASQGIEASALSSPAEAVRWLLATQAQDLPGAKWSVGLRVPGSTIADVDAALARAEIVRSWPMRGTLHLVAAEDLPWMLSLTAERTVQGMATRHRQLGLDRATFERARELAVAALAGGRALTRAALLATFEAHGIPGGGQRGAHLLWYLCHTGTLCLGPMHGGQQAVVLLREWIVAPRALGRDEALGELARRYFASHGPATLGDFTRWTKLPVRDAAPALALARGDLEEVAINGTRYWMAAGTRDRVASRRVHALPGFDEYLLGYQDRSAVLAPEHSGVIVPGNNGMFLATIVSAGQVVGTWRRMTVGRRIVVAAAPFAPLAPSDVSGFQEAITAYGHFVGSPVQVA